VVRATRRGTEGARDRRATALVATLYTLITYLVMFPTWPSRLRTRIADRVGDNLLNLWTLHWVGHNLFGGWNHLWNAPIYWPHHDALGYSESMLPIAALHRGLSIVLRSDVLAFNVVYLGAGFASMLGAYFLARRITGSLEGAFVAGLLYAVATPRLVHYEHFQLQFGCFIPFVILCMIRYFDAPTIGRAVAFGLAVAVLVLSTSYYGLMTLIALVVIIPGMLWTWRRHPARTLAIGLSIAAAIALVLIGPVALKYASLEAHHGYRRVADPYLAAHPTDYLRVPPDNRLLGGLLPSSARATVENYLFPGFVGCILGAAGAVALFRRSRDLPAQQNVETLTLQLSIAAALVLVVLSFGSWMTIAGRTVWLPYHLVTGLPGFAGIRAASRFAAFPLLVLAVLAALGVDRFSRGFGNRARALLVIACAAFLLLETSIPIHMHVVPSSPSETAVDRALARRAPGPVVELPMATAAAGGDVWAGVETRRMWLATIDGDPRVGGYSGGQPRGLDRLARVLDRDFPSAGAVDRLTSMGVRYVVLRITNGRESAGAYSTRRARAILAQLPRPAREVGRVGDAYLIELRTTG
jgi:hypothetical protein